MKYLPILEELFSSDSIIFMLIGLILAVFIGVKMKDAKRNGIGIIVSLFLYAACEVISNIHTTFMAELLLLFIGTIAIGCFAGFGIGLIFSKVILKRENKNGL